MRALQVDTNDNVAVVAQAVAEGDKVCVNDLEVTEIGRAHV